MGNPQNLTKVLKHEHENKWVAISRDYKKIVNYNDSLLRLKKNVVGQDVIFMKMPPSGVYLCF